MKYAQATKLFENSPDVLTVSEVAKTIRASQSFVLEQIHKERLPCFFVGVHFRVLRADVVEMLGDLCTKDAIHTHI